MRHFALLLFLTTGLSRQKEEATEVKVIEQREEELNVALVQCDAEALSRLWDDSLTFVFPNGNLATKSERMAGLQRCTPGSPNSTNESVDARVYGGVAVAIVLSKWTGTASGKAFTTRYRATHVWANRAGAWSLVAAHVSQVKP